MTVADALMKAYDPTFKYTSIQVNKNMQCAPHRDSLNDGLSYIIGLGDYTGGDLVVHHKDGTTTAHNIRNKFVKFDGHEVHHVEPFEGERYSLVFFTVKQPKSKNGNSG
jgi:predicted 2-oxoglutarate/Fe(II)-dependent dioxygenase YbiX